MKHCLLLLPSKNDGDISTSSLPPVFPTSLITRIYPKPCHSLKNNDSIHIPFRKYCYHDYLDSSGHAEKAGVLEN